eukprot:4967450-Heterocapsa_arctica.AAC.1
MDACGTSPAQRPRRVEGEQASWTWARSTPLGQRARRARTPARTPLRGPGHGDGRVAKRPQTDW